MDLKPDLKLIEVNMTYRISEQNCNKCKKADNCIGISEEASEITRQYKNANGKIAVTVLNCEEFKRV